MKIALTKYYQLPTMRKILFTIFCFATINVGAQNALNFDGTDDYVSSGFLGISGSAARTVEAWIRTTTVTHPGNGGSQMVITDWGASSTGARFTFNVLWNNAIRLEVAGNGVSGTIAVNDGNWHHVACVYDPAATNTVKLYVDGVLDTQGNISVSVNSSSGNFQIGRRIDASKYFNGDIDEVKIWNVARSLPSIVADTASEYCNLPSGLIAYYRLNEGAAGGSNSGITSTYEDISNANGTLHNFSLSGSSSNWVNGAGLIPAGPNFITINASACNKYIGPGGIAYDSSGTYLDTLQNSHGCDSVIETNLAVTKLDVSVTVTATDMTANKQNATYRWLDCNNNYAMVTGGTQQKFTPPNASGSYAVQVSFGGCTDTSACYQLDGVGLENDWEVGITVFPNPSSNGIVTIYHPHISKGKLSVVSITGKVVMNTEVNSKSGVSEINLGSQSKGIYLIKLETDGLSHVQRVILE